MCPVIFGTHALHESKTDAENGSSNSSLCAPSTYPLSTHQMLYVLQVLQHVRLPLLSPKFLVGTVGSDPLIKSDEECR